MWKWKGCGKVDRLFVNKRLGYPHEQRVGFSDGSYHQLGQRHNAWRCCHSHGLDNRDHNLKKDARSVQALAAHWRLESGLRCA